MGLVIVRINVLEVSVNTEIIPESEVNNMMLEGLFRRAFIKTEFLEKDLLCVLWDGYRTFVEVDTERKYIKLTMAFGADASMVHSSKVDYVNEMNSKYIFAKFYYKNDTIWSEYYYSYEDGFLPFQFMSVLKRFSNIVPRALEKEDKHGIVN